MDPHWLNLFEITNLSQLKSSLRCFEVSGVPVDDENYERNIYALAGRLMKETRQPVAVFRDDGVLKLAAPAECQPISTQFPLTPHVATLRPSVDVRELAFDKLTPETAPIALQFLGWALRAPLMESPYLWGRGKSYFKKDGQVLGENGSSVSVHEGFRLNLLRLGDQRFYVTLDLTHRYVDTKWLTEHLKPGVTELRDYRWRHCLYHFGNRWYEVQLVGPSGASIAEQQFFDERVQKAFNVYEYTKEKASGAVWVDKLDRKSPAIIYRYPNDTKKSHAAAALCKLVFPTAEATAAKIHRHSVLQPQDRVRQTEALVAKFFGSVKLGGQAIKIATKGLRTTPKVFSLPRLAYQGGKILDPQQSKDYGRERLELLRKQGPVVDSDFDPQYFLAPMSLPEAVQKDFMERLQKTVSQLSRKKYQPTLALYEEPKQNTLYRQIEAFKETFNRSGISRGYVLLMLPRNAHEELHDYLKKEFWPDIQFKCVLSDKVMKFYQQQGGKWLVRQTDHRGQSLAGRYASYIENTALKLLIINRKWGWSLASELNHDVSIGIDVLNGEAGFSFLYNGGRDCHFANYTSKQKERLTAAQIQTVLLKHLREDLARLKIKPKSLIAHRDGRTFQSEKNGLESAIRTLQKEGLLPGDLTYGIIEVHKTSSTLVRLLAERNGQLANPKSGTYFPLSASEGVIVTTGAPFRIPGTAHPLHVVCAYGNLKLEQALQDIFNLSQLAWSAPDKSSRLPITIKLANDFLEPIASEVDQEEGMYTEELEAENGSPTSAAEVAA